MVALLNVTAPDALLAPHVDASWNVTSASIFKIAAVPFTPVCTALLSISNFAVFAPVTAATAISFELFCTYADNPETSNPICFKSL